MATHRFLTINAWPLPDRDPTDSSKYQPCDATDLPKNFDPVPLKEIKYHKIPIDVQCSHFKANHAECPDPSHYVTQDATTKAWEGPYKGRPIQAQGWIKHSRVAFFVEGLIGGSKGEESKSEESKGEEVASGSGSGSDGG